MTCAAPATPTTKRRGRPPKTGRPVLWVVIPKDDSASQATPPAVPRRRPGRPRRSARGTIDKPVYVHESDSESSEDDSGSDSDTEIEDLCSPSVAGPSSRTHNDEPPQKDDLWSPFFPPKELPSFEETSVDSDDEIQCEEEAGKVKNGDKARSYEEDIEDWVDLAESRSDVSAFVMFNRWEDDPKSLRHLPPTKVSTSLGYMAPEAPTYEPRFIWEIKDLSDILDIDKLVEEDGSSSSSSSGSRSPSISCSSTQLSSPVQGLPPTTCTWPLDRVSLNITGAPFRFLSPDDDESSIAASTNAPSTPTESSSGDSFFSEDDYPVHVLSSPLISSPSKQKAIPRAAAMRRTASAPPVLGGPQSVPLLRNLVGLILECPLDGCSAKFREERLGDYEKHFQQHHSSGGPDDRRIQCPCRRWVRMSHIANHIAKTHMDTVGYTCRICNQSRTGVDDIIQHIGVCVRTHKHARTVA